jgi:hypothetical protein
MSKKEHKQSKKNGDKGEGKKTVSSEKPEQPGPLGRKEYDNYT